MQDIQCIYSAASADCRRNIPTGMVLKLWHGILAMFIASYPFPGCHLASVPHFHNMLVSSTLPCVTVFLVWPWLCSVPIIPLISLLIMTLVWSVWDLSFQRHLLLFLCSSWLDIPALFFSLGWLTQGKDKGGYVRPKEVKSNKLWGYVIKQSAEMRWYADEWHGRTCFWDDRSVAIFMSISI